MTKLEFEEKLRNEFNINDSSIFKKFEIYKDFLQKENTIHNLTRLASEENIYGKYFYDSIQPYKDLNWKNIYTVLDVGSGSGIPGIALKIIFPDIKLTIVESITKKTNFINMLKNILDLTDVEILNTRAELLPKKYKNYFDLVTARAVADLYILLELLIPYMKQDGICIIPKGKKVSEEMQNAKIITRKLRIQLLNKEEFSSSEGYKEYSLIYKKIDLTPSIYPRSWKSIISSIMKEKSNS